MPASALRIVQLAHETAWATAVSTASVKLAGVTDASLDIVQDVYQPTFVGTLAPAIVSAQMSEHGEMSISQAMSYQDICYWLGGIFGTAAASAAANTTYVYNYEAALETITTAPSYTVQYGYSGTEYTMAGALATNLSITGEAGGVWEASVDLIGRALSTASMTTGLDSRDVDIIRMSDTKLYITPWTVGTISGTEVDATLISFGLTANPQRHIKYFAGSINPGGHGDSNWESQLTTVMEFNSDAKALVDELVAPQLVQRQLRLSAATGTTTTKRMAVIDFAGTIAENVTLFGERDGNMTVSLTWNGTYNGKLDNFLKAKVQNELDELP
jgi:hypothetical protein